MADEKAREWFAAHGIDYGDSSGASTTHLNEMTCIKTAKLWCHECDGKIVDAADKSTGKFFCQFGHPWIPPKFTEDEGTISDEYVQVVYAYCTDCLAKW